MQVCAELRPIVDSPEARRASGGRAEDVLHQADILACIKLALLHLRNSRLAVEPNGVIACRGRVDVLAATMEKHMVRTARNKRMVSGLTQRAQQLGVL